MSRLAYEAERLIEDFSHGGKLGPKSTQRLLALLRSMAEHIDDLDRDARSAVSRFGP